MPIDKVNFLIDNNIVNKQSNYNTNNIDFSNIIKEKLDKLNEKQLDAENKTIELIKGDAKDIHEVMLTVEEARLSLELAVQIRNKLVEAYQEINRIQV
ncbi:MULTISPECIES: flagellar hook-basal body complex protein FliE [Caloramator]|uniref:Flagellar hook-basal body complex protein FliE n=1 Tax=Caloramator proteoclasticus DSM 10124 TaxID=1121262 RepID=A0A1M4SU93_9CLOT|nr:MULTISPECIES: flagellar hook-basal body complex protein FliE [Caloramator]SHE35776.1 flagellar hook-basal body complex protein FliE [Caloramator proteoclasticus DSM 10124]